MMELPGESGAGVIERTEHVERSDRFDVWHEVPLVPQQTGMSCWAAAAAMLIGWRDAIYVDPEAVAQGSGRWSAYRDGLRPSEVAAFAAHWGLVVEPPRTYSVSALRTLLAECGPLWMGEASPGLHVIVVSGIYGDGTPTGTWVRVLDPWPDGKGERYVVRFDELMRCFENVEDIAGVSAQLLHTGGRGRGVRRASQSYRERHDVTWRVASDARYGAPVGLFVFCRSKEGTAMYEDQRARESSSSSAVLTMTTGLDWTAEEARRVATQRAQIRVTLTPVATLRGSVGRAGQNHPADVREVHRRLVAVGAVERARRPRMLAEAPATAPDPIPERSLPETIRAIGRFQTRVRWWLRYPSDLTDGYRAHARRLGIAAPHWTSTTVVDGCIAPGDASLEMLNRIHVHEIRATAPAAALQFHDFVQSRYTLFADGFDYSSGDPALRATAVPLDWYTRDAGLTRDEALATMFVSGHEGGFDTINSYDLAVFTFGFVQFTASGSLQHFMRRLKQQDRAAFDRVYRDFGIDVSDPARGADPELLVLEPDGRVVRGAAAAQRIGRDPLLTAVFILSGRDRAVQRQQVIAAAESYAHAALRTTVTYSPPGAPASHATFREILTTPEAIATLIDRAVQEGATGGPRRLRNAVVAVARAAGLTDVHQVTAAPHQAAIVAEVERTAGNAAPRIADIRQHLAGFIAAHAPAAAPPAHPHALDDDRDPLAEPQDAPPGEQSLRNTPVLRRHHPTHQPDLILRWNQIPSSARSVDVVLHLHGFSDNGPAMDLQQKARASGLDLRTPGRASPTLGIIPRGENYTFTNDRGLPSDVAYRFPVVFSVDGLRALIQHSLQELASGHGLGALTPARIIVTAHSGGGASLMRLLAATAGTDLDPHELHVFDALYGRADALLAWAQRRIDRDRTHAAEPPGGLRVFYIPGTGTARQSLRVHQALPGYLAGDAARLGRFYRVDAVHGVVHGAIPGRFGGRLLAQADVDLAPQATPPPTAPRATVHDAGDAVEPLDVAEDTAQWNDNPRAQRYFTDLAHYQQMAPLYHARGIQNPARYLLDNIAMVRFFTHRIAAHRAFQTPLRAAEDALRRQGVTPDIHSFGSLSIRPIRGTTASLSKHAAGRAIDIDPEANPRITHPHDYRVIEAVTGTDIRQRNMDVAVLRAASRAFQDRFATWFATLDGSVPAQAELHRIANARRGTLQSYAQRGFLGLDPALIAALRDAGLVWGGSWGTDKDFMHFELSGW